MTKRECAIIMAYTGTVMLNGDDMKVWYDYVEELIGRPVWLHEYPAFAELIKEKATNDFINLCKAATNDSINLCKTATD